jgi:hypothetical protein
MNSNMPIDLKVLSGVIGGSAVVAMGALTMAIGQVQAGRASAAGPSMITGTTSTETTTSGVPAITLAAPKIKGPAPLPSEEQAPAAP